MKSIGAFAFAGCKITSITISEGVESIAGGAFRMCPYLTSVTLPSSLTNMPSPFGTPVSSPFGGCISLTSIEVASDNPSFMSENGVLFNKEKTTLVSFPCGKKGSYTIPDGITTIGEDAFDFMCCLFNPSNEVELFFNDNFTTLIIPSSVEIIEGWGIFYNNHSGLSDVVVKRDTPPKCGSYVFSDVSKETCVLHVPAGSKSLYQEKRPWSDFENIVEDAEDFIVIETAIENAQVSKINIYPNPVSGSLYISGITENALVTISDLNGKVVLQQVVSPNENVSTGHLTSGVYFVKVKDKIVKIIKQ